MTSSLSHTESALNGVFINIAYIKSNKKRLTIDSFASFFTFLGRKGLTTACWDLSTIYLLNDNLIYIEWFYMARVFWIWCNIMHPFIWFVIEPAYYFYGHEEKNKVNLWITIVIQHILISDLFCNFTHGPIESLIAQLNLHQKSKC